MTMILVEAMEKSETLSSITPLAGIIDLTSITNNEDAFVDIEADGVTHAGYWTNYRLFNADNMNVGDFSIGGGID